MPLSISADEKETTFRNFVEMIRHKEEFPDEYWIANWWMGKYVTSTEFDNIIHSECPSEDFMLELKLHFIDWIEEMKDHEYQQLLHRQSTRALF